MANPTAFHNPFNFGTFDITTSQKGKTIAWAGDYPIMATAKIAAYFGDTKVKEYTIGNGLIVLNNSLDATLTLDGADFADYINRTLTFKCNLFIDGDEEFTFKLQILKGAWTS